MNEDTKPEPLHHQVTMDLRMTYGRGDGGENMANHRRNLKDPGSCEVPGKTTITLEEWKGQQ